MNPEDILTKKQPEDQLSVLKEIRGILHFFRVVVIISIVVGIIFSFVSAIRNRQEEDARFNALVHPSSYP